MWIIGLLLLVGGAAFNGMIQAEAGATDAAEDTRTMVAMITGLPGLLLIIMFFVQRSKWKKGGG